MLDRTLRRGISPAPRRRREPIRPRILHRKRAGPEICTFPDRRRRPESARSTFSSDSDRRSFQTRSVLEINGGSSRRQERREPRKPSGLAFDGDLTAVLLDDPVSHGEAEAGPLADVFGCKERIEHFAEHLRRDSGAVILEPDAKPIAGMSGRSRNRPVGCHGGANRYTSASLKGMERIEKHID